MFSGELDRVRHPLISRTRGILLGSILLVAVTAALVSAKTLPFMFSVTLAAFLVAAVMRTDKPTGKLRLPGAPTIHLLLLLLYALLSATWAIRPDIAAAKTLVAMAMAVGTATIIALIRRETRPNLLHMGEGVCIGLLIGLVYLLVELLSDQSIKLAIYRAVGVRPDDVTAAFFTWSDGKLVKISTDDLSRNMSSAALFVWPALMMTRRCGTRRAARFIASSSACLRGSSSACPGTSPRNWRSWWDWPPLCWRNCRCRGRGVWRCSCGSPPASPSCRRCSWRIAWICTMHPGCSSRRVTVSSSGTSPPKSCSNLLLSASAPARPTSSARSSRAANPPPADAGIPETLSTHSHNIYLQTWLELGLIGAVLLTLFGLSILRAISLLGPRLQPYAYATFASAVAMGSSSYGIWQVWYMALFAFCAVTFSIGARLMGATPTEERSGAHLRQKSKP